MVADQAEGSCHQREAVKPEAGSMHGAEEADPAMARGAPGLPGLAVEGHNHWSDLRARTSTIAFTEDAVVLRKTPVFRP